MPRLTIFCLKKFSFGGAFFHTASSDARRLPIQPSPVSRTPTRPTMPMLVRLLMAVLIDRFNVSPNGPGTFWPTFANSVWSASSFEYSTKPATDTARRIIGKIARKLKYVIAAAY